MGVLARGPDRIVVVAGVVMAERGARLHRIRHEPVVDEVDARDVGRALERGIDGGGVADLPVID